MAICAALLPIAIAFDFGGILSWTQYTFAFAVLAIAVAALVATALGGSSGGTRQHLLLAPILVWLGFSCFQTIPLSPSVVETVSNGSFEAYTSWINPLLIDDDPLAEFPISIAPHDSIHACSVFALVAALVYAASVAFHERNRIAFLLNAIALGGAVHACYGLLRMILPEVDLFDAELDVFPNSFGAFVNRNNAALFLNLGLGASLGLLSWRLMALTGQEVDDEQFEVTDLISLLGDRDSMIGLVSAVLCIGGLLLCGSRGGFASILIGGLLAFGWVRQRRGLMSFPVVGAAVAVAAVILLVPLQLSFTSIERFKFFSPEAHTVIQDGRLQHWPDGLAAAMSHLPFGSGLSTYAYAYLPHQNNGLLGWAHHADNLWLELFVEQGVVGIGLALTVIFICFRALLRLRNSPDPIDQGLRTTGWYFLGTLIFSQFFDFGLIVPANLFLVSIFFAAIVSREVAIRSSVQAIPNELENDDSKYDAKNDAKYDAKDDAKEANRDSSGSTSGRLTHGFPRIATVGALGIAIVVIAGLGLMRLKRDAQVELLVKTVESDIKSIANDQQALLDLSQDLTKHLGENPEPELLNALARVEHSRARLQDVISRNPTTAEESSELYRLTNALNRRSMNKLRPIANESRVIEAYRIPLNHYGTSLKALPLGLENRAGQLYLDFVEPNPKRTKQLIEQLALMHQNKPKTLVLLGQFAANSQHDETAIDLWNQALSLKPDYCGQVIELTKQHDQISLDSAIPKTPESTRAAARLLLSSNDEARSSYFLHAIDEIACETCGSFEEKAKCLELRGDIAFDLGRMDLAFEQYGQAIENTPTDANLRLKLVRRLRSQGRNSKALIEARKGRHVLGTDVRFDDIIQRMASEDLKLVEEANEKRSGSAEN